MIKYAYICPYACLCLHRRPFDALLSDYFVYQLANASIRWGKSANYSIFLCRNHMKLNSIRRGWRQRMPYWKSFQIMEVIIISSNFFILDWFLKNQSTFGLSFFVVWAYELQLALLSEFTHLAAICDVKIQSGTIRS